MTTSIVTQSGAFSIADADIVSGDDSVTYRCTGAFAITLPDTGSTVTAKNVFVILSTDGLQTFTYGTGTITLPVDTAFTPHGSGATIIITCTAAYTYDVAGDLTITAGGAKGSNIVYEYEVTGSAQSTIDIPTGVLGKKHYRFILHTGDATSYASVYVKLYVNNDTTDANYSSNKTGTSASDYFDLPYIGLYNYNSLVSGEITANPDGIFMGYSKVAQRGAATDMDSVQFSFVNDTTTVNTIDDLSFATTNAGGFLVGTKLTILDPHALYRESPVGAQTTQIKTKLYDSILAVDTASIDITNIDQNYDYLILETRTRMVTTSTDIRVLFNDDTTNTNYRRSYTQEGSSGGGDNPWLFYTANNSLSDIESTQQALIYDYKDPNKYTKCVSSGLQLVSNTSGIIKSTITFWKNSAAVTKISIIPNTVNDFASGSRFILYGVREELTAKSISALQTGIVGHKRVDYPTVTTVTSVIPWDDTIPQSTEGQEIITITYTPKYADSILQVKAVMWGNYEQDSVAMALFRDTNAGADTVSMSYGSLLYAGGVVEYEYQSNATAPTTFKLRMGVTSGTAYLNADSAGNSVYGGAANSFIRVTEIRV